MVSLMQIMIDKLNRPWGLDRQVKLITAWLQNEDEPVTVNTGSYDQDNFPSIKRSVRVSKRPWKSVDPAEPALIGPYPATRWARKAKLTNFTVILPYLPWDLYPAKKQRWLGRLPTYTSANRGWFLRSVTSLITYPWRKTINYMNRRQDQAAVKSADQVFVYDNRLQKPVNDLYGVDPELINPMAAVGRGQSTDPDNTILAVGPYVPLQNTKRIIDAFYLFVNRLGTQRRENWDDQNPMQMWQPGNFTLHLCGDGPGETYLKEYASSQQLQDQVEFKSWIPPENYDRELKSSLVFVDVPLAGDASPLVYQALSLGVPAVHSRHHRGFETLLKNSSLSRKTNSTDVDHTANQLLDAARIPISLRKSNSNLKKALSVKSGVKFFLKEVAGE